MIILDEKKYLLIGWLNDIHQDNYDFKNENIH